MKSIFKIFKNYVPLFFILLTLPIHTAMAFTTQSTGNNYLAEAVSMDELENVRGREGIDITALNNMNVRATLTGNTANGNVTGGNIIDAGSFTGANGMFSVIQNTGNNVIIQDSTIVNITIVP